MRFHSTAIQFSARQSLTPPFSFCTSQFLTTENDLNAVSQELRSHFSETKGNPVDILARVQRLSKELPVLEDECETIFGAKQDLVDAANRILVNGSTATLNELAVKLGETTELSLSEAPLKDSLQRWNFSVSKVCGMKHADPTMDAQALNKAMMKNAVESHMHRGQAASEEKENIGSTKAKKTPAQKAAPKKGNFAVKEAEFNKLRATMRNKTNVAEVNELFKIIIAHCAPKQGPSVAMSSAELIAAGGKIKNSGDAKLDCLRALKRIKNTRDGIALVSAGKR